MPTPGRVLIVDDTDDSRELAVTILEHAGFACIAAETGGGEVGGGRAGGPAARAGGEAHAAPRASGPDAIVLDVHLPDFDGFEVCRRLKADPGTTTIPVLFLSATYTGLDARRHGVQSGAQGYLTKPYEPEELVSAVTNLVRLREVEAAKEQLRNLGNNLPSGVIYQVVRRPDGSNYFPYMSSGLEHVFGVTAEEAMRDAGLVY